MKKIIQISFNQNQYETATASLQENVQKYRKLIDCIEVITGIRELQPIEYIENFITDKTTFKNVLLSATLLEVGDEYAFIQHNHNKVNFDVLNIEGDLVTTKKEILEQVKEDATQYLSDEYINDFNVLTKASKILNELSIQSHARFLVKTSNNVWNVNLQGLENSKHI